MFLKFHGCRYGLSENDLNIQDRIRKVLSLASPEDISNEDSIQNFISNLSFSLVNSYSTKSLCTEIISDENNLILLDAGTGFSNCNPENKQVHIFLSSPYPFLRAGIFSDSYKLKKAKEIKIYSTYSEILLLEHLKRSFGLEEIIWIKPEKEFTQFQIGSLEVSIFLQNENTFLRFEKDSSLGYTTSSMINVEDMENTDILVNSGIFTELSKLLYATPFTYEESLRSQESGEISGSSPSIAIDIANLLKGNNLILTGHAPFRTDNELDSFFLRALKFAEILQSNLEITMAYDGGLVEV